MICYFAHDASVQSGIQEAPQSQEMLSDPERDGLPANQQMLPRPVAPQGGGLGGPQAGPHGAPPGGHAMPAAAFPPTADALHQSPKLSMEVPLFSSLPGGCGGIHTVLGVSGALDEQRVEACRSAVVARASMADASVQTTAVATHEPNSHGLLSPTHVRLPIGPRPIPYTSDPHRHTSNPIGPRPIPSAHVQSHRPTPDPIGPRPIPSAHARSHRPTSG